MKNEKTVTANHGSVKTFADGELNVFAFNNNNYSKTFQCKKCKSDYGKFAINGICQKCIQRCEYIIREHPAIAAKAFKQMGGVR